MNFLVSPTEPRDLKEHEHAIVDSYCEQVGADIVLFTERGTITIQRKTVEDFVASITDGRLSKSFPMMREVSQYPILLIEGAFHYTFDDKLRIGRKGSRYTKQSIQKILWSIEFCEGMTICYSDSIVDTIRKIHYLQEWMDKKEHLSLKIRPKYESSWIVPVYEERLCYFYQSFPGISIVRARAISKVFNNPMEIGQAYADGTLTEKLMTIPGIGKTLANGFMNFWEGKT